MASDHDPNDDNENGVRRRDFINIAAVSAAGVGALATLVPLPPDPNRKPRLPAAASRH